MRQAPLLKLLVLFAAFSWVSPCWAETDYFEASTIIEATQSGASIESTLEGPAATLTSDAAGSFDLSLFLVFSLGVIGLVWVRRHVQSL